MVGRRRKRYLFAVAAVLLAPSTTPAELTTHLDRAGRLVGAGWGDGYHACESSGIRLGANLPPRSYSQRRGVKQPLFRATAIHRAAATFYDRFDAARGHQQRCCPDDFACDSPGILIDGSEVIQTPPPGPVPARVPTPVPLSQSPLPPTVPAPADRVAVAGPTAAAVAPPAARIQPPSVEINAPAAEFNADVAADLTAPSRHSTASSRLRGSMPTPVSSPISGDDRSPGVTRTPHGIVPTHPGFRTLTRTERLLRAALGEDFTMPPSPRRAAPRRTASQPASRAVSIQPAPTAASMTRPSDSMTRPSDSMTRSSDSMTRAKVASQLPPVTQQTAPASDAPLDASDLHDKDSRVLKGYPATEQPQAIRLSITPNIRTNPLVLPRATLELAKRPPSPDSDFIRQPR